MKFDIHEPIVFALSSDIPKQYRSAVRDGVLVLESRVREIRGSGDRCAPGVRAPSPDYNVIQWVTPARSRPPRTSRAIH